MVFRTSRSKREKTENTCMINQINPMEISSNLKKKKKKKTLAENWISLIDSKYIITIITEYLQSKPK